MLGLRENGSQLGSQFLRYLKSDLETIVNTAFRKLWKQGNRWRRAKLEGTSEVRVDVSQCRRDGNHKENDSNEVVVGTNSPSCPSHHLHFPPKSPLDILANIQV